MATNLCYCGHRKTVHKIKQPSMGNYEVTCCAYCTCPQFELAPFKTKDNKQRKKYPLRKDMF